MNSESYGIFGPGGLLAKLKAVEEFDICAEKYFKSKKMCKNEAYRSISDSDTNPVIEQKQESCVILDHLSNRVNGLSLVSKSNVTTSVISLSDLPPMDAALSIEKIRTAIFSLLTPGDLLNCRLVSSSWLRMATNHKLYIFRIHQDLKSVKDLSDLLDGLGSNPLPCSAIRILDMTIPPIIFVKLFNRYGFYIKYLNLIIPSLVCRKDYFMEFMIKLFCEQMPNLETLIVEFETKTRFNGDMNLHELLSTKEGSSLFCRNYNQSLRTIDFEGQTPFEVIEALCLLAPKLEELLLYDSWGFWTKNKNLLYLLKRLNFMPSHEHWGQVEELEAFIDSVEKINLRKLTTDFFHVRDKPERMPELATLLVKILHKSCHSLEELNLDRMHFLPYTVLPKMPRVKRISLTPNFFVNPEWNFLPKGTSLAGAFPNLSTINFDGVITLSGILQFLSGCKKEEVASVKFINVGLDIDKKIFRKGFPNAVVVVRE